jgi:hypothetical protein
MMPNTFYALTVYCLLRSHPSAPTYHSIHSLPLSLLSLSELGPQRIFATCTKCDDADKRERKKKEEEATFRKPGHRSLVLPPKIVREKKIKRERERERESERERKRERERERERVRERERERERGIERARECV